MSILVGIKVFMDEYSCKSKTHTFKWWGGWVGDL